MKYCCTFEPTAQKKHKKIYVMFYYFSNSNNPAFNLALEEVLLKHHSADFFLLYINSPSVIVGKNQNATAEINHRFAQENGIEIHRRISGGGTVYHDLGNLNYCYITTGENGKLVDFKKYSQPVIDTLQNLGIDAKFEGKSDLTIGNRKFSGNASNVFKSRVMQHGTMLFKSDLKRLNQLLKVNPTKYKDRAIRSNRSVVTNISEHLSSDMQLTDFIDKILAQVKENFPSAKPFQLSSQDLQEIERLMATKYRTKEWILGNSPSYTFTGKTTTNNGTIATAEIVVKNGKIDSINCTTATQETIPLDFLLGIFHYEKEVRKAIKNNTENTTQLTEEQICKLLF